MIEEHIGDTRAHWKTVNHQVDLIYPRVGNIFSIHNDAIVGGEIRLHSYQIQPTLKEDEAREIAEALVKAADLLAKKLEEIEPKAAEAQERIAEEQRQRDENARIYRERRQKVAEIEKEWNMEIYEKLKWYQGQMCRYREERVKGIRTGELVRVNEYGNLVQKKRDDYKQRSVRFKELVQFQIRYEGDRKWTDVELPQYPQEAIDEVYAQTATA